MPTRDPEGLIAAFLRWRWLMPCATVVIAALVWGVTQRFWDNRLDLDATTGYVAVTATERRVHPLGLVLPEKTEILLSRFVIEDPPHELLPVAEGRGSLRLRAGRITLQSLVVTPGAQIAVSLTTDAAELRLLGEAALTLSLAGRIEDMQGGAPSLLAEADAAVPVTLVPTAAFEPLRILFTPASALARLEIIDQRIERVSFTPPRRVDETNQTPRLLYRSELRGGTLALRDTQQEEKLRPRELVWLQGLSATIHRIAIEDEKIAVELSGRARGLSLGPQAATEDGSLPGGDRDVTPTVLEYLLGRHDLKLLWGGAVAVVLALWKARQWALKLAP